jgi:hypothetical protein
VLVPFGRRWFTILVSVFAFSAIAASGMPREAFAAPPPSQTWNGGAALSNNWTNGNNWVSGTAPVANNVLFFSGSTRLTNNDNNFTAGTQFNGITFNAGAGAFTLSGNRQRSDPEEGKHARQPEGLTGIRAMEPWQPARRQRMLSGLCRAFGCVTLLKERRGWHGIRTDNGPTDL